jgi:hypothetical protein
MSIGPIWSALLVALLQTPHRFQTKRQLWAYGDLAIRTSFRDDSVPWMLKDACAFELASRLHDPP